MKEWGIKFSELKSRPRFTEILSRKNKLKFTFFEKIDYFYFLIRYYNTGLDDFEEIELFDFIALLNKKEAYYKQKNKDIQLEMYNTKRKDPNNDIQSFVSEFGDYANNELLVQIASNYDAKREMLSQKLVENAKKLSMKSEIKSMVQEKLEDKINKDILAGTGTVLTDKPESNVTEVDEKVEEETNSLPQVDTSNDIAELGMPHVDLPATEPEMEPIESTLEPVQEVNDNSLETSNESISEELEIETPVDVIEQEQIPEETPISDVVGQDQVIETEEIKGEEDMEQDLQPINEEIKNDSQDIDTANVSEKPGLDIEKMFADMGVKSQLHNASIILANTNSTFYKICVEATQKVVETALLEQQKINVENLRKMDAENQRLASQITTLNEKNTALETANSTKDNEITLLHASVDAEKENNKNLGNENNEIKEKVGRYEEIGTIQEFKVWKDFYSNVAANFGHPTISSQSVGSEQEKTVEAGGRTL